MSESIVEMVMISAQTYINHLETQLAAVTTERDDLAALVRELVVGENYPGTFPGAIWQRQYNCYRCVYCHSQWEKTPHHDETCPIERARRALAALDAATEDKKPENDTRNWPWWD